MKCSEIRELLSLYIDDMLEESIREEVSAHIDACPECRKEYEELVSITRMLGELPEVSVPSDFDRRLREALNAEISGEKAAGGYETVHVSKKKLIRRISSVCAIFVVGIFALTMYNNIDRLIPRDDANEMMPSSQYNYASDMSGYAGSTEGNSAEEKNEAKKSYDSDADYGTVNGTDVSGSAQTRRSAGTGNDEAVFSVTAESQSDQDKDILSDAEACELTEECDSPVSRGSEMFPPMPFAFKEGIVTRGAIADARDSVAIRYYMGALEKMLGGTQFEILVCESKGEGLWSFEIELVSTDEEGNETHEYVTYYGQDGTLWKEAEE